VFCNGIKSHTVFGVSTRYTTFSSLSLGSDVAR